MFFSRNCVDLTQNNLQLNCISALEIPYISHFKLIFVHFKKFRHKITNICTQKALFFNKNKKIPLPF